MANEKRKITTVSAGGDQRVIEVDAPEGEPFVPDTNNGDFFLNDAYIKAHGPANPVRGRLVTPEQLHPAFAAARFPDRDFQFAVDPETIDTHITSEGGVRNDATDLTLEVTDVTANSQPVEHEDGSVESSDDDAKDSATQRTAARTQTQSAQKS